MGEALHWGAYFDGLQAYALGRLGSVDSLWPLLAMGAGNLAIFYNVCLALSCFRIPRAGFVQARLAPRAFENVFAAAAVATFLVGFVYFPLLARLDEYVARSPDPARVRARVERETTAVARQVFERIDDGHYRPGTLAQLASARAAALGAVGAAAERFRHEVDAASSGSRRKHSAGTTSSASSSSPFGRPAASSPTSTSAGRLKARQADFPPRAGSSCRRSALYSRYRGRADATQA